jgi:hypothetical protein
MPIRDVRKGVVQRPWAVMTRDLRVLIAHSINYHVGVDSILAAAVES